MTMILIPSKFAVIFFAEADWETVPITPGTPVSVGDIRLFLSPE